MTPIFHLAPRAHYEATDAGAPYAPEALPREGFTHCTAGIENVVAVANRYYRDDPRPYVLLVLDPARLTAPVRTEDREGMYPHVLGPLDRAAITGVVAMPRAADGSFLTPETRPDG